MLACKLLIGHHNYMSESLPKQEINCGNCKPVSACCQGGTIELTLEEASFMLRGGNRLRTIAQPAPVDRDNVFCPGAGIEDEDNPGTIKLIGTFQPLAAGLGRYFMPKPCVFLEPTEDGGQQCGVYDDRPFTCRRFEVGGDQCVLLRQVYGADPISEATQALMGIIDDAYRNGEQ